MNFVPGITADDYLSMGMTQAEYERFAAMLGREPNLVELAMCAVMWSEHCSYKHSRNVLSYFSEYKKAIEGDGLENAGVIDIGGGLGVVMKIESHNHPSAVEPYQGAATGVGGIIRDILTMGARPIAALNSLRFGPIRDGEHPASSESRRLMEGVVAGIAGYGNCVGVPTVGGEVDFHARYAGNPLVNAMCVGVVRMEDITTAGADGIGNPVIYLGSATGRDGIHGATFASEELSEDGEAKRPNVQFGDPFAEKSLIEATLEALATGAIQSIQDMGAAGLTCSTTEMSAKGGVGMEVDLDLVPMRASDMSAYELMLSESQERMLAVAYAGREHEVIEVFEKWGLPAVVVGRVTEGGMVRLTRHGELAAEVPARALADDGPVYSPEAEPHPAAIKAKEFDWQSLPEADLRAALPQLLATPTIASKAWVHRQYDQQVQTQTAVRAGAADAAVLAPRGTEKGLSVAVDGSGYRTYFDPYAGGLWAVCEAARNVACTGARPAGITDGLNFGSPEKPPIFWQLERCIRGLADAAEAFRLPVVSGNVSLYNESAGEAILPTAMIGMLGVLDRVEDRLVMSGAKPGDRILLLRADGETRMGGLGASAFLREIHGIEDGVPELPDLAQEPRLCGLLADLAAHGLLHAAHDISEGGLAVAAAELVISGQTGLRLKLPSSLPSLASAAYGEHSGWVLAAVSVESAPQVLALAAKAGIRCEDLGDAIADPELVIDGIGEWGREELSGAFEMAIPNAFQR
jgi:phosphoribosylformylglycinamidine synthase